MTAELSLIGRMAAGLIQHTLETSTDEPGTARFLLHAMTPEEVLAIVAAIEASPQLAERIEICLPRHRFADVPSVQAHHLTDEPTADLRHAECDRGGRLLVLTDSERQTMAQIDPLDAEALMDEEHAARWIDVASGGMALSDETKVEWEAALAALLRMRRAGLRQVAQFVSGTAAEIASGERVARAVGRSLPALRVPRFDALFDDIPPAKLHQPSQWYRRFGAHWRRDCYIAKRDRTQMPLPARAKLREKLEEMREQLREEVQTAIEAYIDAPDGASEQSFALFHTDWSELQQFFEEAQKSEGRSLGQETSDFYKIRDPELLSDAERDYLKLFV